MKNIDYYVAYKLLDEASLNGLSGSDKISIVKLYTKIKQPYDSIEEIKESAKRKLKPNGFDDLLSEYNNAIKTNNKNVKDDIEQKIKKYESEINMCIAEEANKDIEISIPFISIDCFEILVENNDWNAKQIELLNNVMVEK